MPPSRILTRSTLALLAALAGSAGCTLLSSVDRDSIPSEGETTDGGAGGDGATGDAKPDQGSDAKPDGADGGADAAPDATPDAPDEETPDAGDEQTPDASDEQTPDAADEQTPDAADEQAADDGGDQDAAPDATDEQTTDGGGGQDATDGGGPFPNGAACASSAECASHVCAAGTCEECATDVDCTGPGGSTCDANHQCQACTTPAECANGGWGSACASGACTCVDDTECTNGRGPNCFDDGTNQRCGCGTGAACAAGELCTGGSDSDTCKVAPGFGCALDADCASGSCAGGVCAKLADGTPCAHGDECTSGTCGGGVCKAAPQCTGAGDCPQPPSECVKATCTSGQCGTSFVANGTPLTSGQTVGNCTVEVCDGNGGTTTANDDMDVPGAMDACHTGTCTLGTPGQGLVPEGTTCGAGTKCDGSGNCVQCVAASDCGVDTECQTFACNAGTCEVSFVSPGFAVANPTVGDCHTVQCDGAGNAADTIDDTDLPVDGNQCTADACSAGVASNPASAQGSACTQGAGTMCDGAGLCVQCMVDADCPAGGPCQAPKCTGGTCGFVAAGAQTLPAAAQTAGDCQVLSCDGASQTPVSGADDGDVPSDANDCTSDLCTSGVPSHPPAGAGTSCDGGNGACDGAGACLGAPDVASTTPADGALVLVSQAGMAVTFTQAMNPATLTMQTADGACTGSIQVSTDGFTSCVAIVQATPVMSAGDTVGSFTLATTVPGTTYKLRVTTAAKSALGVALAQEFTTPTGFTTAPDVVISQVYGGGGNSGATYKNDFVVLHNRGAATAQLAGLSLQYSGPTSSSWGSPLVLSGTIQPGGYFLVQLAAGSGGTIDLPTPDQIGTLAMGGTAGKVALALGTVSLSGSCPSSSAYVDFVGYGATANCSESAPTATLSNTTAAIRINGGCTDSNNNSNDFTAGPPAPQSSATTPVNCP